MNRTPHDPWDAPGSGGSASIAPAASHLCDRDTDPSSTEVDRFATPDAARYLPLQLLGRGGMGLVTEVHDLRLDRNVALKHRRPDAADGALLDERLARETAIAARLDHPGIVPVLDAGVAPDGLFYYTMPIVQGQSLATALSLAASREGRLRYLRRVLEACEAVAWAHRRGIAHGDLKPANIMLAEGGGTRVLDWGLARVLAEPAPAATGGTPQYMSPEQALGAPADTQSDVWSLGAILFEVAAGRQLRPPDTPAGVIERARAEARHTCLRLDLDRELAPELVTIIHKALAPHPAHRYPDARALADDLASFLDGRRVTAHQYSAREILVRFVRAWRVPLLVIAIALVVVAVLVVIGITRLGQEAEVASRAQGRAETSEAQAREAFTKAAHDLSRSLLTQALLRSERGARAEAEILAAHALLHRDSPRGRGVLATWAAASPPMHQSRTALPPCLGVALSERGDLLLCRELDAMSAWDLSPLASPALRWRRSGPVRIMAASTDVVAAFTSSTDVILLDPRDGALLSAQVVACEARLVVHGRRVIATNNGCFWVHDLDAPASPVGYPCLGRIIGAFAPDLGRERWAALCEDGALVEGRFDDPTIATATAATELSGTHLALSGAFVNGRILAGTGDGDLVLLDPVSGATLARQATGSPKILELTIAPDERLALVRSSAGAVALYSTDDLRPIGHLPELTARVAAFAGEQIVVLADDLHRFAVTPSTPSAFFLDSGITSVDFDARGDTVAATSGYRLEARRLVDGALTLRTQADATFFKTSAFSQLGTHLFIGSSTRRPWSPMFLRQFETETWQPVAPLEQLNNTRRIVTRADGTLVYIPYFSGLVIVDPDHPAGALRVDPAGQRYADLASSPDGRFAAALGEDDRRILRFLPGLLEPERVADDARATSIAIARDGVLIATAGERGLSLWDADRGALTGLIELPGVTLTRVALSPDMRWLAAGARDGRVWIWELGTLRLAAELVAHKERVSALAFSPDSRLLASGGWDGWVRVLGLDVLSTPAAELVQRVESAWGHRLADILDDDEDVSR